MQNNVRSIVHSAFKLRINDHYFECFFNYRPCDLAMSYTNSSWQRLFLSLWSMGYLIHRGKTYLTFLEHPTYIQLVTLLTI